MSVLDPAELSRAWATAPFVGRSVELGRLVAAVSAPPSVVTLSGAAGLGKSRLVAELVGALPDVRVLVGRCPRLRDPFPLGPIAEVVRQLGPDLAGVELSPAAGALRSLVPELADRLPVLPTEAEDRLLLRHVQFRGLVDVLRGVGRVVLVVEDAHWADPQTVEFLEYLLPDPPPGLSVLLTYRADEVDPSVPALAARANGRVAVDRVELAPWDAATTGELAAGMFGVDWVSEEFAEHLCRRAAGIPLAVQELLRLLLERGSVTVRSGEWLRRTIDKLDVPAGVRDPVLERVGMLDESARRLVEAAAVLQVPVSLEILAAVADLSEPEYTWALEEVARAGLVVERDRRFEPVHPLSAQAVYDSLVPVRRRGLHRRAAAVLRTLPEPPLGQLAHHLRAADQTPEWIDTAEAAAEQMWLIGDDEEVVDLLEPALRAAPPDPLQQYRLAFALGRSAIYSSRAADIATLLASLPTDGLGWTSTQLGAVHGNLLLLLSNTRAAPAMVRRYAYSVAENDGVQPSDRVNAVVTLCTRYLSGSSREDALRLIDRAADQLRDATDEEIDAYVVTYIGSARLQLGVRDWCSGVPRIFLDTGPCRRSEALAVYYVADAACLSGHYALAHRLARRCLAVEDKRIMPPVLHGVVRSLAFEIDYWCGRWEGLEDSLRQQLARRAAGALSHEREHAVLGGLMLARLGPTEEVTAALDTVLDSAAEAGLLDVAANAIGPRARALRAPAELPGLDILVGAAGSGMVLPSMYRAVAPVTRMLCAAGEVERARSLREAMSGFAPRIEAPLAAGALAHAEAHDAAHDGRWAEAVDAYLAAAAHHDIALMPYEAAQAREDAAVAMLHTGHPDAADAMGAAVTAYRDLGAIWDLDRASGLARQHGISVPARHRGGRRGYGNELSPREREVADLAATGRTNREIAEALYLSVNTVNRHLSAALRKLGLTSRRQLPTSSSGKDDQALL